jgi:predicted aldo/keto reductase-like oxidoreductase
MKSPEQVDEYLGASGWESAHSRDGSLLVRYARENQATQCRYGCNSCASACPHGVPIAEVLRTRMYAHDYGDLELAKEDYTSLGDGAAACLSCAAAPCANACPHGVRIPELTGPTHRLLRVPSRG